MRVVFTVAVVAVCLIAADAAVDSNRADIAQWQGTWRAVSMQTDGKLSPADKLDKIKLTVAGIDYHFQNGTFDERGSYKFDAEKNPKQVDIVVGEGPDKGKIYRAIYAVDADELTICLDAANKQRPTSISGKAGTGCVLEIWKRVAP